MNPFSDELYSQSSRRDDRAILPCCGTTGNINPMKKVACYIDGFNLYHAIDALNIQRIKWLDLQALARTFLRQNPEEALVKTVYFTAKMYWDKAKAQRHTEYINALRTIGVECVVSKFEKRRKHCHTQARYCDFREEKQTDVAIATRVISDCLTSQVERVIFITSDSDQVPTIAALRGLRPDIDILVAAPPGRKSVARELGAVAHSIKEIELGRLNRCLLPRDVKDPSGKIVARGPSRYF